MSELRGKSPPELLVAELAARGCNIRHADGSTCIEQQESACAARDGGQPRGRPRWGSDGRAGAFRDHVADGGNLCDNCRAQRALEGTFYPRRSQLRDDPIGAGS